VRPIRIRNAARPIHDGQNAPSEAAGFTFVDTLVGLLIAGIIAAIVVFAVATMRHDNATHARPTTSSLPTCTSAAADEVTTVNVAVGLYYQRFGVYPKALQVLVQKKFLAAKDLPAADGPSHSAGFMYNPENGTYATQKCSLT
jgi:hypothetical protein